MTVDIHWQFIGGGPDREVVRGGPDQITMGAAVDSLDNLRALSATQASGSLRFVRENAVLYAWVPGSTDDEQAPALIRPTSGADGAWRALRTPMRDVDTAPTEEDDETTGAWAGEFRIHDGSLYICVSAAEGAAVWVRAQTTGAGGSNRPGVVRRVAAGTTLLDTDSRVVITSSGTTTLPASPAEGQEIFVRVDDPPVVLNGNGWTIDTGLANAPTFTVATLTETVQLCAGSDRWYTFT